MKNSLLSLMIFLLMSFLSNAEKKYVIQKIHSDGSVFYDINNKGEIAFIGSDLQGKAQIFLFDGLEIHQITENLPYSCYYSHLDLNEKGQISWTMFSKENTTSDKYMVMFYDGKNVVKAQDNLYWNYEIVSRLNNSGTIVWHGIPGYGIQPEIFRNNGSTVNVSNSTVNPDLWPMINNKGTIVWYGDNRNQNEWANRIRYIKTGETEFSTVSESLGSAYPQIDENDNIIFSRLTNEAYNLCKFNGTSTVVIDDSVYNEGSLGYKINNGNIVYSKGKSGSYSIYLLTNSGTSKISLPGNDNYHPSVNSSGVAVWRNSINEVFVKDVNGTQKIGIDCALPPLINDNGQIVWAGSSIGLFGNDIYFAEFKEATWTRNISTEDIKIYPNPAMNKLIITFDFPSGELKEIVIYDVTGRVINQIQPNIQEDQNIKNLTTDLTNYEDGIYFCTIKTRTGNWCKSFIKTR
jgi:hypothetical protein